MQIKAVSSQTVTQSCITERIVAQIHNPQDAEDIRSSISHSRKEKNDQFTAKSAAVKNYLPESTKRAVDLAMEKGASSWLTAIPIKDLVFVLNKAQFWDAIKLRYDWEITDLPSVCVCGEAFSVDHAMICRRGGFVIQRHNELRDLEAEMLDMVCYDVEVELVLQVLTGETLERGARIAPDARLDIHARGLGVWERQRSAFFDVRVFHPNADSYRDLSPKQIYRQHENEKKRKYATQVSEIEQGTFTRLVFSTTGGMGEECQRFHRRLAELLASKKGEDYSATISWIRCKVSFAVLRTALLCLRGSRTLKRVKANLIDTDFELDNQRYA